MGRLNSGVRPLKSKFLIPAASILGVCIAAYLVYVFFDGDSCADAGGSYKYLRLHCDIPADISYESMLWSGTLAFWAIYATLTVITGALLTGAIVGVAFGLTTLLAVSVHGRRA